MKVSAYPKIGATNILKNINLPDKSPEPTAASSLRGYGANPDGTPVSRQVGIHVASRRWLSFFRQVASRYEP